MVGFEGINKLSNILLNYSHTSNVQDTNALYDSTTTTTINDNSSTPAIITNNNNNNNNTNENTSIPQKDIENETFLLPYQFQLLSIDVDGCDYHVWNSLDISVYQPQVVCIEFNPTIPNRVKFIQEADIRIYQGR